MHLKGFVIIDTWTLPVFIGRVSTKIERVSENKVSWSEKYLKKRLVEYYHEKIVITTLPGSSTVL